MLTIRSEQMDALSAYMIARFERDMVNHIAQAFPKQFAEAGDAGTRKLVHDGIAKAASYGVQSERNVALFIDLMVAIGPTFDHDDRFPWVRQVLQDPDRPEQTKLDMIYDRMRHAAPRIALPTAPGTGR